MQVRFAVININHGHIHGQVAHLVNAGAEFVAFYAPEADLAAAFAARYPHVRVAASETELLEDSSLHLIVTSGIPASRAALGVRAMRHGKDFMTDKPGFTTLAQLEEVRGVQAETQRIYSVCYSEHFEVASVVRAGALVAAGAIGRVVQTLGMGPHKTNLPSRPAWYFERDQYGGILTDIGSHQAEQFLFFTGATNAEVVSAQVANYKHPQHLGLEDFGEMNLRGTDEAGNTSHGYVRLDWYTPDGLGVWGDGRLTILGTEGYIELRKYVDPTGRDGGEHLILVDQKSMRHIPCTSGDLPYGRELLYDIVHRSETHMPQWRCFLAAQLSLEAQAAAVRLGHLLPVGVRA